MFALRYGLNLITLVLGGKIWLRTALRAWWERPIAVCGEAGSYVVDPTFE